MGVQMGLDGGQWRYMGGCTVLRSLLGSSGRIGHMTGLEGSGAWNELEHFLIVVRLPQMIKTLPAVQEVHPPFFWVGEFTDILSAVVSMDAGELCWRHHG